MSQNPIDTPPIDRQTLNTIILQFTNPSRGKAAWQLTNTLIPYVLLWIAAILLFQNGYPFWTGLIPMLIAGPFLVRLFIIFHDCCHSSYFRAKWANELVGYLTGALTFTPYTDWAQAHTRHH
ncbi:MAG: fatty acid desaturase, partial [Pseudomonadota bacterium]